jgi:ABC-type uncharacterized transport system permease subunit
MIETVGFGFVMLVIGVCLGYYFAKAKFAEKYWKALMVKKEEAKA